MSNNGNNGLYPRRVLHHDRDPKPMVWDPYLGTSNGLSLGTPLGTPPDPYLDPYLGP
jgi:hypothetical protein